MSSAHSQILLNQIVGQQLFIATVIATKNGVEIFKMIDRPGKQFSVEELQPIRTELVSRMGEGCIISYEFSTSTQLDLN